MADLEAWAVHELGSANYGDARLNQRGAIILAALAQQPNGSIPAASGNPAAAKATYRHLDNDKVTPEETIRSHIRATVERCQGQDTILVAQDTCFLNYTTHPMTEGLGPIPGPSQRGLIAHTALAMNTDGVPLGVVGQQIYVRESTDKTPPSETTETVPTAPKETDPDVPVGPVGVGQPTSAHEATDSPASAVILIPVPTAPNDTVSSAPLGPVDLRRTPGQKRIDAQVRAMIGQIVRIVPQTPPYGVPQGSTDSPAPSVTTTPTPNTRKKRSPKDPKESQRWIDTMRDVSNTLNNQRVIFIADREADIFDLFVASTEENMIPLIRAK